MMSGRNFNRGNPHDAEPSRDLTTAAFLIWGAATVSKLRPVRNAYPHFFDFSFPFASFVL